MSRHESFELSKLEIQSLTGWPDSLVEDYRNIADSINELYTLIENTVPAGYGGASQEANIAFAVPTGYITLPYDTLNPAVQRGVEFDLSNETFSYTAKGVWRLNVVVNIQGHNSSNGGRSFDIRIYNETTATAGSGLTVGVGRNQEDTLISIGFLIDIPESSIGDNFRVEMGGNDTVTGGTLIAGTTQMSHVSELGLLL